MGTVLMAAFTIGGVMAESMVIGALGRHVESAERVDTVAIAESPCAMFRLPKGVCGMSMQHAVAGCTGRDGTTLNDCPPAAEAAQSRPEHRMGRIFSPMSTLYPFNQPLQHVVGELSSAASVDSI